MIDDNQRSAIRNVKKMRSRGGGIRDGGFNKRRDHRESARTGQRLSFAARAEGWPRGGGR